MKRRELENLGFKSKDLLTLAQKICKEARLYGLTKVGLRKDLETLSKSPDLFLDNPMFGALARELIGNPTAPKEYELNEIGAYKCWGEAQIDPDAQLQMTSACRLPITVSGALMPDAHVGYGLPIGGVLATDNAVIPYAVGVDIACRVMITAFDIPMEYFYKKAEKFKKILEDNTQFGIGANWQKRKDHSVMSDAWGMTPLLKGLRDKAWSQLGTSGSGNHFVEFGELEIQEGFTLAPGRYLALVSHSGSRGAGASIAMHYSNLARKHHPNLPKGLKQLAWLPLDHEDGIEYWESMQLMGRYASANHHIIHESIGGSLRAEKLMQVENHHNFAWKEVHGGKEVVVHRKGATPAGKGVLGYIPGSMTAPGFLVEGKGNEDSLYSCSHGAGRRLSRKQAKNSMTLNQLRKILSEAGVELLSAGLDEAPHAYKDINQVMSDQRDLVQIRGRFQPRLVKMASPDEKPED